MKHLILISLVFLLGCDNSNNNDDTDTEMDACSSINSCFDADEAACTESLTEQGATCPRVIDELDDCLFENGCSEICDCYHYNYLMHCGLLVGE